MRPSSVKRCKLSSVLFGSFGSETGRHSREGGSLSPDITSVAYREMDPRLRGNDGERPSNRFD
jgi:hypothetical protein